MIPAEVKKRENIAEYIVHMYQTEDLITTFNFNLDEIYEYVIRHMSKEESELKSLLLWYADVIDQMRKENLPVQGKRLAATQAYVKQLGNLHEQLLDNDEEYSLIYGEAENDIQNQVKLSQGQVKDPIQACLNAVYGKLVINLNGKSLPPEHEKMVGQFGRVLAYLAKQYHRSK